MDHHTRRFLPIAGVAAVRCDGPTGCAAGWLAATCAAAATGPILAGVGAEADAGWGAGMANGR